MSSIPIGDHALLSDCHSAALVNREGSVEWLCFPRFDSPSVFGRLLDDEAGHWSIRPAGDFQVSRRYLDQHHGARDHVHHRDRHGHAHRRAGPGRRPRAGTISAGARPAC